MAIDTKMRYNPDAGEVELVVGEAVAMSSGKDVMDSWGKHWAESNGYVPKPTDPPAPVQEPKPEPEEAPVTKDTSNVPEETPVEEVNHSEPARPPGGEEENSSGVDSDS